MLIVRGRSLQPLVPSCRFDLVNFSACKLGDADTGNAVRRTCSATSQQIGCRVDAAAVPEGPLCEYAHCQPLPPVAKPMSSPEAITELLAVCALAKTKRRSCRRRRGGMSACAGRATALCRKLDAEVVVAEAPIEQRHLVRPVAIHHSFAQLALATDHGALASWSPPALDATCRARGGEHALAERETKREQNSTRSCGTLHVG